jgi:hypothetical protein
VEGDVRVSTHLTRPQMEELADLATERALVHGIALACDARRTSGPPAGAGKNSRISRSRRFVPI